MDREAEANSKAVHVRLPWPMWEKIAEMAEREASTVAAVLRRLAKERLDQIEAERRGRDPGPGERHAGGSQRG